MNNIQDSSSILVVNEDIDRIIHLCTKISQMAIDIRSVHLSNIYFSRNNIHTCYDTLLSMAENIEGSVILLESLLKIHRPRLLCDGEQIPSRIHYTREQLLELRKNVTYQLLNDIGNKLKQVVDSEANDVVGIERKSWRDIRTILM